MSIGGEECTLCLIFAQKLPESKRLRPAPSTTRISSFFSATRRLSVFSLSTFPAAVLFALLFGSFRALVRRIGARGKMHCSPVLEQFAQGFCRLHLTFLWKQPLQDLEETRAEAFREVIVEKVRILEPREQVRSLIKENWWRNTKKGSVILYGQKCQNAESPERAERTEKTFSPIMFRKRIPQNFRRHLDSSVFI